MRGKKEKKGKKMARHTRTNRTVGSRDARRTPLYATESIPCSGKEPGRIIGKGGQTINRIQDDTGARIDILRDEQQCVISARVAQCTRPKVTPPQLAAPLFQRRLSPPIALDRVKHVFHLAFKSVIKSSEYFAYRVLHDQTVTSEYLLCVNIDGSPSRARPPPSPPR